MRFLWYLEEGLRPKAEADNTNQDLDYSGISPKKKTNLMIVLLYIVLKKIRTNRASHGTQFDIAL